MSADQKFGYIDATRGWAILGVLIIHATTIGNNDNHPAWLSMLTRNGSSGVQLFYLASALTLFLSFSNRKKVERNPTRNFFIRRYFRIAPLYYIAVLFYLWLEGFGPRYWLGDAPGISTGNIIGNFLLIHQLSPYWINSIVPGGWSIAVETSFYLFVPLLFSRIRSLSGALYFFSAAIIAGRILNPFLAAHNPTTSPDLWGNFLYFYLPTQLPVFAIGIMLFFMIAKERSLDSSTVPCGPFALLFFALTIGWNGLNGYLLPMVYGLLVYAMSRRQIVILDNAPLRLIGRLSYGIYICHWGSLALLKRLNMADFFEPTTPYWAAANFGFRFAALLMIAGIIAYALRILIEVPFQNLGKQLIHMLERRRNDEKLAQSTPYAGVS